MGVYYIFNRKIFLLFLIWINSVYVSKIHRSMLIWYDFCFSKEAFLMLLSTLAWGFKIFKGLRNIEFTGIFLEGNLGDGMFVFDNFQVYFVILYIKSSLVPTCSAKKSLNVLEMNNHGKSFSVQHFVTINT